MEWGTVAGLIAALATLITAIGGAVVTATVLIPTLRVNRSTHTIVNQQRTDMLRYQNALVLALRAQGIDVPADQSKFDEEADRG